MPIPTIQLSKSVAADCPAVELPPSNRTPSLLVGLLLNELTRGLETQSTVRVDGAVILKSFAEALENRNGFRAGVRAGVVALESLHERLAHAGHA